MASLEERLGGWTEPSSATEQDKQERTERMIREAIKQHSAFDSCDLTVYAKGSYANNTNVKTDSDVDIAVQCGDCCYWEEASEGAHPRQSAYSGIWTPDKLRAELGKALTAKFDSGQVDQSGSTAFRVRSSTARVDADVVPCFDYRYYFSPTRYREGVRIFKKSGTHLENYPAQQLENGKAKNNSTTRNYKRVVRIMKRVENAMVDEGAHREVPSYFIECLVYNCPDSVLRRATWTDIVSGVLYHIWEGLSGDSEPSVESQRWLEVNECKYLFHPAQAWTRADGRDFAKAAWNYLGLGS